MEFSAFVTALMVVEPHGRCCAVVGVAGQYVRFSQHLVYLLSGPTPFTDEPGYADVVRFGSQFRWADVLGLLGPCFTSQGAGNCGPGGPVPQGYVLDFHALVVEVAYCHGLLGAQLAVRFGQFFHGYVRPWFPGVRAALSLVPVTGQEGTGQPGGGIGGDSQVDQGLVPSLLGFLDEGRLGPLVDGVAVVAEGVGAVGARTSV